MEISLEDAGCASFVQHKKVLDSFLVDRQQYTEKEDHCISVSSMKDVFHF